MNLLEEILYCPALRMKNGELEGVRQLASDVADRVLPRFIVPPSGERDEEAKLELGDQPFPDFGIRLATHWQDRPMLLDCGHILDEFGRDRMSIWLPRMFADAREKRALVIPAARLADLGAREFPAFRSAMDVTSGAAFAFLLSSADLADTALLAKVRQALDGLGTDPNECVVVIDFGDADLSSAELAEPIIRYGVEIIQEVGTWRLISFQATGFPEKNPAADGGHHMVRRSEWLAWKHVVSVDPAMLGQLVFGDYAADCSKIAAGKGGMAIRHLRYTSEEYWRVQRGQKAGGSDKTIMGAVCQAILSSGHFSGAGFSAADAQISSLAKGQCGAGTASTWRQLNTTHHITVVVSDLVKMRGGSITARPLPALQLEFAV